jgi:hypothetical protein
MTEIKIKDDKNALYFQLSYDKSTWEAIPFKDLLPHRYFRKIDNTTTIFLSGRSIPVKGYPMTEKEEEQVPFWIEGELLNTDESNILFNSIIKI